MGDVPLVIFNNNSYSSVFWLISYVVDHEFMRLTAAFQWQCSVQLKDSRTSIES